MKQLGWPISINSYSYNKFTKLAHPPINPRLTFEEFLSQSDIKQNNPSFKNKETILNTIEELNSFFFKLNEKIKKSQAKKSL